MGFDGLGQLGDERGRWLDRVASTGGCSGGMVPEPDGAG